MYFQYLRQQEEDYLIKYFFKAQMENPVQSELTMQVLKDLEEVELNDTFGEIKEMSQEAFKMKVKEAVKKAALKHLNSEKKKNVQSSTYPTSKSGTPRLLPSNGPKCVRFKTVVPIKIQDD